MSKCPWCGAPTDNNSKYNGMGFNQSGRFGYYVYTCGYSTNPDFNRGCSNRNQRIERDEITQPPEPDHEEPMPEETTANTAEVEQARIERVRVRVEAVVAAGATLDMQKVETLNDYEWSAYLGDLVESKRLLDAATAVAAELSALGDECTPAEAIQLTSPPRILKDGERVKP